MAVVQGIRTFDEQGRVMLDVTDRLTKIIGFITLSAAKTSDSGFIDHPDFTQGTPFYFTTGNFANKYGWIDGNGWKHGMWKDSSGEYYLPVMEVVARQIDVTFSGTRMTWAWRNAKTAYLPPRQNAILYYGVY